MRQLKSQVETILTLITLMLLFFLSGIQEINIFSLSIIIINISIITLNIYLLIKYGKNWIK